MNIEIQIVGNELHFYNDDDLVLKINMYTDALTVVEDLLTELNFNVSIIKVPDDELDEEERGLPFHIDAEDDFE